MKLLIHFQTWTAVINYSFPNLNGCNVNMYMYNLKNEIYV